MNLSDLGQVIAERRLRLVGEEGEGRQILVLLGSPRTFPDSPDYYCPYQITGIGDGKIRHVGGVDAFQALEFALQALGAKLQALNQDLNGKLRWDADEKGSLGFPVPE
jgi:hypothetical protein